MEFYIHTWWVYGVEISSSIQNKMNEKQVKLNESMIAFEKKIGLLSSQR